MQSASMLKPLIEAVVNFVKLYESYNDPMLLVNCEKIEEYQQIIVALDQFSLEDLKLDQTQINKAFIPNTICATTLFESPSVSVGYFFIPAGMSISLHDHPGMLVTSKILYGEVKRRALDLVDRDKQFELPLNPILDIEDHPNSEIRLDAVVDDDEVFKIGEMINLTPIQGNIHSFSAVSDTIIFDILTPYYDQETRFCNFYKEIDGSKPSKPTKPVKKSKKAEKESLEEPKEVKLKGKGEKTTLVYLYQPPKINFSVVPCSPNLLE